MTEDRRVLSRVAPQPTTTLTYGSLDDQVIDIYQSPPDSPTTEVPVVFIHGGYWRPEYDRIHARNAAAALAHAGWTTALVEYRRLPGCPDATIDDVRASVSCALEHLGTSEVILVGHSAGGHLALLVARDLESHVAGVVALAPVSDLVMAQDLDLDDGAVTSFLGAPADTRPDLDPARRPRTNLPASIVHGAQDSIVPIEMSRQFSELTGTPVHVIDGIGHYELIDPLSQAWTQVIEQLRQIPSRT